MRGKITHVVSSRVLFPISCVYLIQLSTVQLGYCFPVRSLLIRLNYITATSSEVLLDSSNSDLRAIFHHRA